MNINSIVYEKDNYKFIINVNECKIQYDNILKVVDQKIVFNYLNSLYGLIYDWKEEYVNHGIIDGNNWKLLIIFNNGSKKEYRGKANCPDNFEAFERLNYKLINEVENG